MKLEDIINRDIVCTCGQVHRCDIEHLIIDNNALKRLSECVKKYSKILLIADNNTYPIYEKYVAQYLNNVEKICRLTSKGHLVPDEQAIEKIESLLDSDIDFILGVGSGVINDLCKFVSFNHKLKCGIIATAPSMDGYASSGAALIEKGMKVTYTTHAPSLIVGDVDILKNAPIEMIRSGYADIIGKYSALCDWKLSNCVNGEYLCENVYSWVMDDTNKIRSIAKGIAERDEEAIKELMQSLILIGVCMTLVSTTRPASGSEHHMSHYFEITGLINNSPYFAHGIDVGYSTVVTASLREEICKILNPKFYHISDFEREKAYKKIYGPIWKEVWDLQEESQSYEKFDDNKYIEKWDEILKILEECPDGDEIKCMLTDVGIDLDLFEKQYGLEKIQNGVWFSKDLKNRYSVLWIYDFLFFDNSKA